METGTIPPNWENLFKYSSEMATAQDIDLADTCLQGKCNKRASDQISGPFVIVTILTNVKRRMPQDLLLLIKTFPYQFPRGGNITNQAHQLISL